MPAFKKHFDRGLVERWVKALRSGRYKQTTGGLEAGPGSFRANCCLGVACRVAHVDIPRYQGYLHTVRGDTPTDELRKRLGIDKTLERRLAALNDKGVKFPEIADVIESELLAGEEAA